VKDGKVRWNNIHRLHGGCRPLRSTAVFKDNGELMKGPSEGVIAGYNILKRF